MLTSPNYRAKYNILTNSKNTTKNDSSASNRWSKVIEYLKQAPTQKYTPNRF